MGVAEDHRGRRKAMTTKGLETLPTTHLIALHERLFGPLDRHAKARLIAAAQVNGWDRQPVQARAA
jgi:hypothetical protein